MSGVGTTTPREERHKGGTLKARGQEIDGLLHGYWEWFREDGTLMRSGSFDRGEQVGEWTTYGRDGTPTKVTHFAPRQGEAA